MAPGGGNQDANCEAPERTSPTSWRRHVHPPRNSFRAEFRYASAGRRKSGRESCGAARKAGGRRKVRWRSSSPLRGFPPLTWPRMAMPFDRPPASWLFAPRISDTNKWCKSTSRKRQEAELRTRIAKHLSGRVRPPDASKPTDHRPRPPSHANNHYLRPQSRTSVRI